MESEARDRWFELLKKTEADVIADWKWPKWRPDGEEGPERGD